MGDCISILDHAMCRELKPGGNALTRKTLGMGLGGDLTGRGHTAVSWGHQHTLHDTLHVDHDGGCMTPMLVFVQWRLMQVLPTMKCMLSTSQRRGRGAWTGTQAITSGPGTKYSCPVIGDLGRLLSEE